MLVLSRKIGTAIEVDGPARVTILDVRSDGRVKVGVEAEEYVHVIRSELLHSAPQPAEACCGDDEDDDTEMIGE